MSSQYKVFFSWQSEDKKSRKAIDVALQNAVETLSDRGIRLEIDLSTLGESGMPSIDQTILRKIDSCDIFLADVTPVTNYQKKSGNRMQVSKEVPNPNVLLELGYAMSALGVGYVIVAAHQGNWVLENMPFDINHRAIYSFTSSNCDLTSRILEVIEYIKRNGRHRHLDKSYLINWIEKQYEKLSLSKTVMDSVISEESTVFFRRRMARAFPGYRGLVEFKKARDINRHLSKLLESPIQFRKSIIGVKDPIWWFRAGSALNITTFRHLNRRKFLIGWNELVIRRIVAFIDNGRYYSNYVYVEAQGAKPTGLEDYYTSEKIKELKESLDHVDEEYAIYKPCAFFRKMVTKQEEDDGFTKILGRLVKMKKECVETRCRFLTDYNFIIAAKGSAYNNAVFDRTSGDYFKGLLEGTISIEAFHNYMMQFPKPDKM
ncbi:MAG: hypothetical protein ACI4BA_03380 [Prevotella sp.]